MTIQEKAKAIFATVTDTTPGCAVAVLHKGQVVFEHYAGKANLEHHVPISSSTVFPLASISKMFTALMIGLLEKEGRLSMNSPVSFLLELDIPETVTVQHLITMTSGLRETFEVLTMQGTPRWEERTTRDHIELLKRIKSLNFAPGSDVLYTNINFILAALIVEKILQMPFEQAVGERILKPLGMSQTSFWNTRADFCANGAEYYVPHKDGFINGGALSPRLGLGSMASTLPDMIKFLRVMRDGSFSGINVHEFWSTCPTLANGITSHYGRGCMMGTYRGVQIISHSGGFAGCASLAAFAPALDIGFVLLANNDTFDRFGKGQALFDLFAESLPGPVTPQDCNHLNGVYLDPSDGEWISIDWQAPTLVVQHLVSTYKLSANADNTFSLHWGTSNVILELPQSPTTPDEITLHIGGVKKVFIKREKVEAPAPRLTDYIGKYQHEDTEAVQEILFQERQLMIRFGHFSNDALTFPLIPTAKDTFLAEGGPVGWGHSFAIVFDREPHSKMLRGYRISSHRLKNMEFRRLRMF